MKTTIVCTIITVVVLLLILFTCVLCQKKLPKEKIKSIADSCKMTVYNMLMFVGMMLYLLGVILCDEIFGGMNPAISALLLVLTVFLTSRLAFLGIYSKQERTKEDNKEDEKKFAVLLSSLECAGVFFVLAQVTSNSEYCKYGWTSIAIIIGFFVSLDILVDNRGLKKVLKRLGRSLIFENAQKILMLIPTVVLTMIVIGVFVSPLFISEEMGSAIYTGLGIGCILFLIVIFIVLKNKTSRRWVGRTFFDEKE